MLAKMFVAPSLNSLFVTGFLLLVVFFLFVTNFRQIMKLDYYRKIQLLSLLVVAVGVHGLVHLGVEQYYSFNPYNWV